MKGKLKKPIAFLMMVALVFNMGFTAFAEDFSSNQNNNTGNKQKLSTVTQEVYGQPAMQRAYEIRYLLESTGEPVPGLEAIKGSGEAGTTVDITHPSAEGYEVLDNQPEYLVISEDENKNIVEVYYEQVEVVEGPVDIVTLTAEVEGVTITVSAEAGVIPEGASLSAVKLSDEEYEQYIDAIEENQGIFIGNGIAVDITLRDADGNEIQPNGEVTVSFAGLEAADEEAEVAVFHVEPRKMLSKVRTMGISGLNGVSEEDPEINNVASEVKNGKISFKTNHFSIYIVGTNIKAENTDSRYKMHIGDILQLEERYASSGGTWSIVRTNNNNPASQAVIVASSNSKNNIKATIKAVAAGTIRVRYNKGSSNKYFYIEIVSDSVNIGYSSSYDAFTPAREPEPDPNAPAPGTVTAEKDAEWVDYDNRIARIDFSVGGEPMVTGSDVILVMDISLSMEGDRITTAKQASRTFIDDLLGEDNPLNNRVAFIPFQGDDGGAGYGEVTSVTKGSVNFSYNADRLKGHVNATKVSGSTNYTAALQKAIYYADSRLESEKSRPLYIVFMSDGAPGRTGNSPNDKNWNGVDQASALKGSSYNATIYTVGIQLTGSAPDALRNISSTVNGEALYESVSDMEDLEPVLVSIAGKMKKAGLL